MNRLKGLMRHDEGQSPEPQNNMGLSRKTSRSKRFAGFSGQGSHFPPRHPSMRAGVSMKSRQDTGKQNGFATNGIPGPITSSKSPDGVVGHEKGKAPSDDIIGTELTDQEMVARTERPQFNISEGSKKGPGETDGGAILPSPIPATTPKLETPKEPVTTMEKSAAEEDMHKPHGGITTALAGGATATVAAAAAAVGVHAGLEKETEEEKAKKMEEDEEDQKKVEEEQKRVDQEQKRLEEEQKRVDQEQKKAEEEQKKMEEEEQKRKEEEEEQKKQEEEQEKKKEDEIAAGGISGKGAGEEETPEESEPEPREPKPSLAGATLGLGAGGKTEGEGKGTEETTAPQKDENRTPEAGGIPGMFPTESEQQPASEATQESKEAAGGEGVAKQADTSGTPKSYAAVVAGGAGAEGTEQKASNMEIPTEGVEEKAAPSAMATSAEQPTDTSAATAGVGKGGVMGTAAAGIAGVAGGAGIAQKAGGDKATMGEEIKDGNKTAAEETEQKALAERQLEEKKVEEETGAYEQKLQQKREELERQKREEEELKEKRAQTEREIKEQEEAMEKEKERKKELGKEEKGHEKAIGKEEKRREKEAKKAEEKARKKQAKQAKRASSDVNGGKKSGGGGGLFGFLGRRMSSKGGGGSDEAAKATQNGSKTAGKQPMKPEAETDAGAGTQAKGAETTAPESKTNGTAPNGGKSGLPPLTTAGETSDSGGRKSIQDGFPKLDTFPTARGGGTVSPFKTRTHSGPQFQANIPSYVTP